LVFFLTMPFPLRAFLFTLLRSFVIIIAAVALNQFEVSPLPDWILSLFVYAMHFSITFLFAVWALAGRLPSRGHVIWLFVLFLVGGTACEMGLYVFLAHPRFTDLFRGFNLQSLVLLALYAIAITLAVQRARKQNRDKGMPEGLSGG